MFPYGSIATFVVLWGLAQPPLVSADPAVVFHRGSTVAAPENTLLAMEWAVESGATVVEIDLRVSRDGHIVVIHDSSVNRTTNGEGLVHLMSLEVLRTLDAGRDQRIPTLTEAFDFARRRDLRLVLDVKDPNRIKPHELLSEIERRDMSGQVVVGSRSVAFIRDLQSLAPEIDTLAFAPNQASIEEFLALEVEVVRLWVPWIRRSPELVEAVRAAGADVWINTRTLDGAQLQTVLGVEVDGLITDRPLEVLSYGSTGRLTTTD